MRRFLSIMAVYLCLLPQACPAFGQTTSSQVGARIDVRPKSRDQDIARRLSDILIATQWYVAPSVEVRKGVVFLGGETSRQEHQRWAEDLARNTEDVVAVVNDIVLSADSWWQFTPALDALRTMWRGLLAAIPTLVFSLIILVISWWVGRFVARASQGALQQRLRSPLLCAVLSRTLHIGVFLAGMYLVLQLAGLTNVAFTIVGGTGLLGLILGIAFREITENFLASMFLTLQQPFQTGDLIELAGVTGLVQRLTARSTTLMTLEGNHVQIPNATVYKSVIRNFTSNPNRREEFIVGIGFDDTISQAQEIAMAVLRAHPAILKEPEPWVLVDNLGKATVNLRIYFWLDGNLHSWLKVRSSAIRLIKRAFQEANITMPDEARELVFPKGVPVTLMKENTEPLADHKGPQRRVESALPTQPAEGGLVAEQITVEAQARSARIPEEGKNLLSE